MKFDGGNINMSRYSGQELFSFNYSNEQEFKIFVSYARYHGAIEQSFNQFVGKIDQNIEQTKIQIAQGEVKYSEFMQKHENTLANLKKNPLTLEQFQIETQAKNLLSQLQTSLARFEASKSRITSLNQFHETIAKKLMAEYETDPQTRFDERSRDFRSLINPSWNFIMSEAQTSQSDRIPGESMVNIQRNTKPILTLVDLLDFIPDNLSLPNWKDIRPKLTVDSPIPSDLELAENISFTDYFNQAYLALAPVEENQNLDKIEKYLENCEAEFVKFYEKHGESLEIEQNYLFQEIERDAKI